MGMPGMMVARFWFATDWAEPGAPLPLPATRGDRGETAVEKRLWSGVSMLLAVRFVELVRGSGWPTDLALAARELVMVVVPGWFRVVPSPNPTFPSSDVRVDSVPAPLLDMRLGLLF